MFKVADLRNKILFTLLIIAIYRMGSHVPVPGIDFTAVKQLQAAAERGGVLGFLNLFSGGALTRFAVFGLGIMPYITSSIIVQLLGVVITQRGIGQGMSILIFVNVVAGMPAGGAAVKAQGGMTKFIIIVLLSIALLVAIVFTEQGQRRIPVQFAKRVVGRRMYGGQSTYIPLKFNQAGVIPIIFASSVLYFPALLSNVVPSNGRGKSVQSFISANLLQPSSLVYIGLYGILIVAFAYFYTAITFDPHQQADIIRKQGGYIPGIRPGPPTERHLHHILNRITLPGALFLAFIALLPSLALAWWGINRYPFAGTTLLIAVGVALETMKQVDSQLMMRNYEGFLK